MKVDDTQVTDQGTENTEAQTTQTTQVVEAEPTLDDVYKSAGVDESPIQSATNQPDQPAPHQAQTQIAATPPDPYDTDAHKAYLQNLASGQANMAQGLNVVAQFLNQQQQAQAKAKLEADLSSAVETVNKVVNHPNPKVIEAMLDAEARGDVRFKKLWDNRDKNPQAWNNALRAASSKFAKELEVKVDPKLRQAQQIRRASQGAMATTDATDESENAQWDNLSTDDFDRKWQQAVTGQGWN